VKIIELQDKLTQSMKEKNRVKKTVIADMVTCAKNMAIEKGCKDNIPEEIVDAAILKSKKICQEQIDTCPANRPDILEGYKICMSYIDELAPKMMSEDEVRQAVKDILAGADVSNKGAAMKLIMPALKGKADGKVINKIVTEVLNG
jgi:uncharacterized protein YqeY